MDYVPARSCKVIQRFNGYKFADDALIITDIVSSLEWTSVTIIYKSDVQAVERIIHEFHSRGVFTKVLEYSPTSLQMLGSHLIASDRTFLVLGPPHFVQQVFSQAAESSDGTASSLTVGSEWLTVLEEDQLLHFSHVTGLFENLVVIGKRKTGSLSLWTMRHVRDDSELSFVSTLPPSAPPPFRHHILPNFSYGLGGRTLRVVVKTWDKMLTVTTVNGRQVYRGFIMDIFEELAHRLNFSYTLIPPSDDNWGQELDNGQWDGPIGMLTRKEVDLAVSYFTLTPERSLVVDPTTSYIHDNAVIVFSKSKATGVWWWTFFLQPFQTTVYLIIGGCLVLMLLLMLVLEKYHWSLLGRPRTLFERETTLLRVMMNFEILLAGLVNRPYDQEHVSRAGRVLVMTWLLMSVILASVYSSQLTSSLTISKDTLPFTSLSQLLNQDTYTWGVPTRTAQESLLKGSTKKEYRRFYERIADFAKEDPDVLSPDLLVHKAKIINENYAVFMGSKLLTSSWLSESCDLVTLPERFKTTSFGFYLQKGSPFTNIISDQINLMVDSGLTEHWRQKWMPGNSGCDVDKGQGSREIGLDDTLTSFCLAVLGLGMAVIVLGIECLCRCRSRSG